MGIDPAVTKAVLVNFAFVAPSTSGYLTAWAGRSGRPLASNINAVPWGGGRQLGRRARRWQRRHPRVRVRTARRRDRCARLLQRRSRRGRARGDSLRYHPTASADTREPLSANNQYTRGVGPVLPYVRVPVAARANLPAAAMMDAAVLVVTAVTNPDSGGGFLSASPGGSPFSGSSNLNTNGAGDIRANLVVVPLGADGTVDLHLFSVPRCRRRCCRILHVGGCPCCDSRPLPRDPAVPRGRHPSQCRVLPPAGRAIALHRSGQRPRQRAGDGAQHHDRRQRDTGLRHAVSRSARCRWSVPATPPLPGRSTPCCRSPNSARAPATMSYYTLMNTDLVVDTPGYFEGG